LDATLFAGVQATEQRDKVVTLLGLAIDISANAIIVDYLRSIFRGKLDVIWFYHSLPRFPDMRLVIKLMMRFGVV
jgi:hypothetical protein